MSTRSGTLTRAIAIDALSHILTRHIHADTALEKLFSKHSELRPLDKAFIFEMVYGSLRWLAKMDWIMSHMVNRPFSSLDPRVANALRIGTYQIYYMDKVPHRAAVSETVEAAKQVGASNAAGFVNAVLRRIARKAEYFPKPDKDTRLAEYYAMHYSHPKWMVERWMSFVSSDRIEHLFAGNNTEPVHTLRILKRNPLPDNEDLGTFLLRVHGIGSYWRPQRQALRVDKLPPFNSCSAFRAGAFMVQDEAAQVAAGLVAPTSEDTILDACAAPGGKAIFLWDEGATPANMTICDSSVKRLVPLRENFARVHLEGANIVHCDATECVKERQFTKILLDAPCSSTGVIRRHPEIKWLRTLGDIEKNAQEQSRLLDGLAPGVAPGGELIYIVCSIEREETVLQIERFLGRHPEFSQVELIGRIPDYYRRYLSTPFELFVVPGNPDQIDGFFAVVLKKRS